MAMSTHDHTLVEYIDGVVWVTLNRPERLNALTQRVLRRRRITHADLIGIYKRDPSPGPCYLGEDPPGDSRLADTRGTSDPQNRNALCY